MNVCLPKAQDLVPTLGKVGIARPVSVHIALLDGVQAVRVDCGVGVPKVPIPLNNKALVSIENIHNKLTSDDFLLGKVNTNTFQDGSSCNLEPVRFFVGRKSQNTIYPLHIDAVIAAGMGAILNRSFESPTGDIERITTRCALSRVTTATSIDRVLSRSFFGFTCVLPSISAIYRTERNGTSSTGGKLLVTVAALVSATFVAPLGIVRVRQERLTAFFADAWVARNVFHAFTIPWSVTKCD